MSNTCRRHWNILKKHKQELENEYKICHNSMTKKVFVKCPNCNFEKEEQLIISKNEPLPSFACTNDDSKKIAHG